jgi:uncharacterized membrane protein
VDAQPSVQAVNPQQHLIDYTNWIYALHAFAVLTALLGAWTVVLSFAASLPSVVAVIMNYARRSDTRGTWLETHFAWQIRTFWFTWLWIVVVSIVSIPLMLVLVGFFLWWLGLGVVGLWVIYRVVRGWLTLREGRPMPLTIA